MYPRAPIHVFLLTFAIERDAVLGFLNTRPEVVNWFTYTSNAVLVASRSDLTALTGIIHVEAPGLFFLLVEVDPLRANGFQTQQIWDFINNPQPSGRWPEG